MYTLLCTWLAGNGTSEHREAGRMMCSAPGAFTHSTLYAANDANKRAESVSLPCWLLEDPSPQWSPLASRPSRPHADPRRPVNGAAASRIQTAEASIACEKHRVSSALNPGAFSAQQCRSVLQDVAAMRLFTRLAPALGLVFLVATGPIPSSLPARTSTKAGEGVTQRYREN